jgi:hypothetical protein
MSPAEFRRVSIESSVLKKKPVRSAEEGSIEGESRGETKEAGPISEDSKSSNASVANGQSGNRAAVLESCEGLVAPEGGETTVPTSQPDEVAGLGMGELDNIKCGFTGPMLESTDRSGSSSSSSHPASPSQKQLLITPGGGELYRILDADEGAILSINQETDRQGQGRRGEVVVDALNDGRAEGQGRDKEGGLLSGAARPASVQGMKGIRVVSDGEGGNVYFREEAGAEGEEVDKADAKVGQVMNGDARVNGTLAGNGSGVEGDAQGVVEEEEMEEEVEEGGEFEPMFASLAHTDAQKAEIARMREETVRRQEIRRGRSVSASGPGVEDRGE